MARLFVFDVAGGITADIETFAPILREALEHEKADSVIRCAMLMALSALAQGGQWPTEVLESMAAIMSDMKDNMHAEQLM